MLIHAWLEEREIRGLRRAFRGRLTSKATGSAIGVATLPELHQALDRILDEAGVVDEGEDQAQA